ncbi:MAG: XF1762 family protein [Psychrobacillus sp.]
MYVIVDLRNGQELLRADDMDTLIRLALQTDDTGDIFTHTYIGKEKEKVCQNSNFVWIFYNSWYDNYIAIPERELTDETRYIIEGKGFDLYSDSVLEGEVKAYIKEMLPHAKIAKYEPVPITLKEAQSFINQHHRHHKQPQGHRQSVGITVNNELIGVIVAGRPVSRHIDYRTTLEVTRCCVLEGFKNAVSKLYGQICKIAKATGYKKVITYTLVSEPGTSLKAVGFQQELISKGGSWNSSSRKREDKHPILSKIKWSKVII